MRSGSQALQRDDSEISDQDVKNIVGGVLHGVQHNKASMWGDKHKASMRDQVQNITCTVVDIHNKLDKEHARIGTWKMGAKSWADSLIDDVKAIKERTRQWDQVDQDVKSIKEESSELDDHSNEAVKYHKVEEHRISLNTKHRIQDTLNWATGLNRLNNKLEVKAESPHNRPMLQDHPALDPIHARRHVHNQC